MARRRPPIRDRDRRRSAPQRPARDRCEHADPRGRRDLRQRLGRVRRLRRRERRRAGACRRRAADPLLRHRRRPAARHRPHLRRRDRRARPGRRAERRHGPTAVRARSGARRGGGACTVGLRRRPGTQLDRRRRDLARRMPAAPLADPHRRRRARARRPGQHPHPRCRGMRRGRRAGICRRRPTRRSAPAHHRRRRRVRGIAQRPRHRARVPLYGGRRAVGVRVGGPIPERMRRGVVARSLPRRGRARPVHRRVRAHPRRALRRARAAGGARERGRLRRGDGQPPHPRGPTAAAAGAGVSDDQIGRLRSPIGLDLGGRSAEETALSILAEVVAVRNGGTGAPLSETSGAIHASRTATRVS